MMTTTGGACGMSACSCVCTGGISLCHSSIESLTAPGKASAADIEALIERAQAAVRQRFGIDLEREVRIIGEYAA